MRDQLSKRKKTILYTFFTTIITLYHFISLCTTSLHFTFPTPSLTHSTFPFPLLALGLSFLFALSFDPACLSSLPLFRPSVSHFEKTLCFSRPNTSRSILRLIIRTSEPVDGQRGTEGWILGLGLAP